MNRELPDVQLGLEKADEPEIKLPTFAGSQKKLKNFRKTASLTMLKSLTVWITTNCGKFLKRWEYQAILPASWETCMQVKKQYLELNMEQWTGSKLGKSTSRLYIVTLLILLTCRVPLTKCWGRWLTSWNQDCWEKYQQPQIGRWYHFKGRKWRGTK